MTPNLNEALGRAIHYLMRQQDLTGAWYDFPLITGYGSCWPTAFAGLHLASVRPDQPMHHAAHAMIARARRWLLSNRTTTGGWGFSEGIAEDADSTGIALLFMAALEAPELDALVARALNLLNQGEDGGVSTYHPATLERVVGRDPFFPGTLARYDGWTSSVPSVTAAAIQCWCQCRGEPRRIERATAFLLEKQGPDGRWEDYWWRQPYYPIYMAVSALQAANKGEEAILRAGAWVERTQAPDGGWPLKNTITNAFSTALAVLTLLRVPGASRQKIEAGIAWLVDSQNLSGAFPPGAMMVVPPSNTLPDLPPVERMRLPHLLDDRSIFTTAVAVRAMAEYLAMVEPD